MDQRVLGEEDFEVDIEAGRCDITQESTSVKFGVDDLNYPLMGNEKRVESLDHSEKKCDSVKVKKFRKASKPPRPPKGPNLSLSDHKVMREIAELAMRKRERIERMKISLRKLKAAKSSSTPSRCVSVFSMIVTVLFFVVLVFQGLFASNSSLSSEKSPAPVVSPNNQMASVQFYNDFAPGEQTDSSPTASFRYTRKRISGMSRDEFSV